MPALRDVQHAFREAVLGDGRSVPGLVPPERLSIHRNNAAITLTEALATTFPVTRALLGEGFFDHEVGLYVREEPPSSPVLFEYGGSYPAFLAALPALADMNYVADVARLEWALNQAFTAPDLPVLGHHDFATLPPHSLPGMRFTLHPAVTLLDSDFAIADIWQAHQPGGPDLSAVEICRKTHLVVFRDDDLDAAWAILSPGEAAFLRSLAQGGTVTDGILAAQDGEPARPPTEILARILALPLFTAIGE